MVEGMKMTEREIISDQQDVADVTVTTKNAQSKATAVEGGMKV